MKKSDWKVDYLKRDGKIVPLSDVKAIIKDFLIYFVIVTPLIIFLAIITFVYQTLASFGIIFKKEQIVYKTNFNTSAPISIKRKSTDSTGRIYDLIIYGATGFTGNLAANYVAKQYGNQFRWAIAGRSASKLEEVKKEILKNFPSLGDIAIVLADSTNYEEMTNLVTTTKVVISTVGPFSEHGECLVRCCVENGTDYCDITAEVNWVRYIIQHYQEYAEQSGAKVVHFCGHDNVPWEMSVLKVARTLLKRGEELSEIRLYDDFNSAISGGSIESMPYILDDSIPDGKDDFLLRINANQSTFSKNQVTWSSPYFISYDSMDQCWVGPFVMSRVMAFSISRTNAMMNYSKSIKYHEVMKFPNFLAAFISTIRLYLFLLAFYFPPLLTGLKKGLPAKGKGPSLEMMKLGYLKVTSIGKGTNGSIVKSLIYFSVDAGYTDTARMLVESGLVLALEPHKINKNIGGGIWTPGACQGEALLNRLIETGCAFELKTEKESQ